MTVVGAFATDLVALQPALTRYARALQRRTDVDDLVQDTLLMAWAQRDKFQSGTNLKSWTTTLLHNIHVNQCRRAANERAHLAGLIANRASTPPAQEHAVALREIMAFVDRFKAKGCASKRRKAQFNAVVPLHALGYHQIEIGRELGIPTGTVASRLSRAQERVRAFAEG